ncbi:MerR family transcriptional regulator [Corynebacterium yudongzhengii]|uniref:MerR family transcriptional regulator n=1 Tax=Corynebacterium yudongzhengii TaxID=2080740 RepID=A0A2U1T8I7_9CORY|nr:MerR family transcriptional regulator [Corynebacterium yudongzhengii]AWB81935.1 MerR family transcriptional regulator [Corynebacterium yudongzhengii]PWC02327.1 MerR family transcriptional regulator [Corynebacterium yudongzhengii]
MSIGVVLEHLNAEFPDVTVSKIRFLESEGLITPQRTKSGYRRFTDVDVERLRYILTTQRDNYLPLKVIREQLEAMDSGEVTSLMGSGDTEPMIKPENFAAPVRTRLTSEDVASQAGCTEADVADLVAAGLIKPDVSGFFTADDVRVVTTAMSLKDYGFRADQLKRLRTAAHRHADLISQVAGPLAQGRDDTAKQRAEEYGQQISALVVSLHASLVKAALREEFEG